MNQFGKVGRRKKYFLSALPGSLRQGFATRPGDIFQISISLAFNCYRKSFIIDLLLCSLDSDLRDDDFFLSTLAMSNIAGDSKAFGGGLTFAASRASFQHIFLANNGKINFWYQ